MPPVLDVFNQDCFNMNSLTAAVNNLDYLPQRTRDLGIFEAESIETTTVMVEEQSGTLTLVQSSERGGPPRTRTENRRTARTLNVPHIAVGDRIYAESIQNVRAFGGTQLETIQNIINQRMAKLRRDIEATHENLRLGALKGTILDADGSTTLHNLFTVFGVSQISEVDFALDDSSTDVLGKCNAIYRSMAAELGALGNGGFRIHALCSSGFFDSLINHANVKATYINWAAAEALRQNQAYRVFSFGGIDFEDYRGSDDGTTISIAANKAQFFPIVRGLYKMYYSPADYQETVNTPGLPFYAKQAPDPQWNKYTDIEVQSNPLPICLKPRVLMVAKRY